MTPREFSNEPAGLYKKILRTRTVGTRGREQSRESRKTVIRQGGKKRQGANVTIEGGVFVWTGLLLVL